MGDPLREDFVLLNHPDADGNWHGDWGSCRDSPKNRPGASSQAFERHGLRSEDKAPKTNDTKTKTDQKAKKSKDQSAKSEIEEWPINSPWWVQAREWQKNGWVWSEGVGWSDKQLENASDLHTDKKQLALQKENLADLPLETPVDMPCPLAPMDKSGHKTMETEQTDSDHERWWLHEHLRRAQTQC